MNPQRIEPLLMVKNLKIYYPAAAKKLFSDRNQYIRAVDDVSFSILPGESYGIAGESGSGKSTLLRGCLFLEKPTSGEILYKQISLNTLSPYELSLVRKDFQMIFQNPASSLNPSMKVMEIIREPLDVLSIGSRKMRNEIVKYLIDKCGLPHGCYQKYPGQFSLGQQQRIAIARALTTKPVILFADEPISSLDVSTQAQILNLLQDLKKEFSFSIILVTHDLSVLRNFCGRAMIMLKGKIAEERNIDDLFTAPRHTYTKKLIGAARFVSV